MKNFSDLNELSNSKELSIPLQHILTILCDSINDWPEKVVDLNDFKNKIFVFINKENIDKEDLEKVIGSIDYLKYSWQGESLFQMLEIFEYYPRKTSLIDIFKDIEQKLTGVN